MKKKYLHIIRMTLFYSTLSICLQCILLQLLVAEDLKSQTVKSVKKVYLEVQFEDTRLLDVFKEVENKTEYKFFFDKKDRFLSKKFNFKKETLSVENLLLAVAKQSDVKFRQVNNNISVFDKGKKQELILEVEIIAEVEVTGSITDENGGGLPGASVVIKGTNIGTTTDLEGNYKLNVNEDAILTISYVGYLTQEVSIAGRSTIDVNMQPDAEQLDEIVVIGYGTQKKKDLTGSIVNVRRKDFEKYTPGSVSEILRSTAPGVKVGYSTDAKATPDFEIRGDNSIKSDNDAEKNANKPLIVLDGVIFYGDLSEINIDDIETVDVLKDASAASIYGSRASNGVVVFTTKVGVEGKPVMRFSVRTSLITGSKRLSTFKGGDEVLNWLTDMNESINDLSTDEWSQYDKFENVPSQFQPDWLTKNGIPGESNPETIASAWVDQFGLEPNEKENFLNGTVYDWQDFLFHTGVRKDYDFSISGKANKVNYFYSLGYSERESVQVQESFKTITSRLNLDVQATNFLNLGVKANFSYQEEGQVPISNGGYRTASPYDQPWENNVPRTRENLKVAGAGSNRGNPFLDPAYKYREYDRYILRPIVYAKLTLPLGITFTSNYSTRMDFRKRFEYEDSANPLWSNDGYARRRHNQGFTWQSDNIINWDEQFGDHRFSFTGLINAESIQNWETDARTQNFSPTEALGFHALNFGLAPQIGSDDQKTTRNALMARINYSFSDRFNISASIRRDGYSRFGSKNLYATFPSLSGAWTITNEAFMESGPKWLSYLKLRASWGVNGNSSGLNSYAAYASLSDDIYLNYDGGYFVAPYLEINRIANPELSWEKNNAFNFALDFKLFESRVSGTLDVYTSETTELLLDKKLPTLTGFSSITTNVGNLRNKGIDLGITTVNVTKSNFIWTSTFNIHYNSNKIVSLTGEKIIQTDSNGNPILDGDGNPVLEEPDDFNNGWFIGQNKDVIWEYEVDGVYQIGEEAEAAVYGLYPGDFKVVDQDGNGIINIDDKAFQGLKTNPWHLTLRNDIEFKNFDVGVILLAKLGQKGGSSEPFNARQEYIKNHNWYNIPYWTPNNGINDAARINSIQRGDNIWVSNSYLRVQSFSVGYTIPQSILERVKIRRARLGFNVDNLAVMTSWKYGDPESQFEMPRTYTFSLDFNF